MVPVWCFRLPKSSPGKSKTKPQPKTHTIVSKHSRNQAWLFHAVTENQSSEMEFGFMWEVAYLTDLTTPEAPESIQKTYKH